jgi:hypothetical protein
MGARDPVHEMESGDGHVPSDLRGKIMTGIGDVIAGAGQCVSGSPAAIALLVAANGVIGLSYLAFLAGLVWFVRRSDLLQQHRRLLFLLGAFMLASAVASLNEIFTYWYPAHWSYQPSRPRRP